MNALTSRADPSDQRRRTYFWMTVILLLGAGLRFFQLNDVPLRGDEAFTVLHWMREPLEATLSQIATIDPQPPLAYALYRAFGLLIGSSEPLVRLLPALLNLLGVAALYGIGKRIGGRSVGLVAAALFAISPVFIWHAQDARNYGIWAAFSALALWSALRALDRNRLVDWAIFVTIQITACYFYYLELLFLGALTAYVLLDVRRDPRKVLRWYIALAVIGLALAPWFIQPRLLSGGGYTGTAGQLNPALYLTWFLPSLLFGEAIPGGRELWFTTAALLTVASGFALLWRPNRRAVWLLALYSLLPLIAIGVVSTRINVFVPRYVLSVGTVLILLAAVVIVRGLSLENRNKPLRLLAIALPVLIGWSLLSYYFDYAKSPDWRALVNYLAPRTQNSDLLVNSAADMSFPFYVGEMGVAGEQTQLPANPRQSLTEIQGVLADAMADGRSIWIVANPPDWPNQNVPDQWLREHGTLFRNANLNGMRADEYVTSSATENGSVIDFGDVVRLIGEQIPAEIEPDGSLPLILDFEVLSRAGALLKTFVHVVGPTNPATGTPLWAQDDQPPQDSVDTRNWEAGTRYRDRFVLGGIGKLPESEYEIEVGWYDPVSGERLPVGTGDATRIAVLTVNADGGITIQNRSE
ncbi:MAG: glycosyltransferase family 39 protein [Anaerolineae bacterium]